MSEGFSSVFIEIYVKTGLFFNIMKIGLIQQNNKYGFVIVAKRDGQVIFNSFKHYLLVPFLDAEYKYAWEAQRDANKLFKKHFHHLIYAREDLTKPMITDISAEEMLVNHYKEIYDGLEIKTHGLKGAPKEERDKVYQEAKMVKDELKIIYKQLENIGDKKKIGNILMRCKDLIKKYFRVEEKEDKKKESLMPSAPPPPGGAPEGMPPVMASLIDPEAQSTKFVNNETKEELLECYGEKICRAVEDKHTGAHYIMSKNKDVLTIYNEHNNPIIRVGINDKLHVNNILPLGDIHKTFPYYSVRFYQKYWKPIVDELGHFYFEDAAILILPSLASLPDVPKNSGTGILKGWDVKEKKMRQIEISFKGSNPSWFLNEVRINKVAENTSKYTEQEYINSIVKCIDPKLKSIFGRTGAVIQIIPYDDFIEVDVDFGRGIGIIRLTEKQLDIVPV